MSSASRKRETSHPHNGRVTDAEIAINARDRRHADVYACGFLTGWKGIARHSLSAAESEPTMRLDMAEADDQRRCDP